MVLIPTSLAEFSPECFPEQVVARSEGYGDNGHVELNLIMSQVFSIVKIS